jgi:hypothetical protein
MHLKVISSALMELAPQSLAQPDLARSRGERPDMEDQLKQEHAQGMWRLPIPSRPRDGEGKRKSSIQ